MTTYDTKNQSDRTLLESAAKAAGIGLDWDIPPNAKNPWRMTGVKGTEDYGPACEWNPLTDDGDALRLAMKLKIDVLYGSEMVAAETDKPKEVGCVERFLDDPYAATRRAIVRAAAAIGENL